MRPNLRPSFVVAGVPATKVCRRPRSRASATQVAAITRPASPTVIVTAPATSKRSRSSPPGMRGTATRASTKATTPTGTFTQNTDRQPSQIASAAPMLGARTGPSPAAVPTAMKARAARRPSSRSATIARPDTMALAPPSPWRHRPSSSTVRVGATAQATLPSTSAADPPITKRRRPWASFGPLPQHTALQDVLGELVVAPDGCATALDAEGCLWLADALGGRAVRVREGGEILDEVSPGTGVYACALGGPDGRTLVLCTAPDFLEHNRRAERESSVLATTVDVPVAG